MNTIQPPRGTCDYFDQHLRKIEYVSNVLFSLARLWGYLRVDTPTFEHSDVFRRTCAFGEDKCFVFKDKSSRELVLRPDVNAPLSRLVINNLRSALLPVKLFFADKVFRYRHDKKREFRMFGLEIFGIREASADIEAVSWLAEAVKQLGFSGVSVRYSDVGIVPALIRAGNPELADSAIASLVHSMRHADSQEDVVSSIRERAIDPAIVPLVAMFFQPGADSQVLLSSVRTLSACLSASAERMSEFGSRLSHADIPASLEIQNLHGSGFYSGLTYRVYVDGCGPELADGGRFDHMNSALGGPGMPATGLGFGLERIVRYLDSQGLLPQAPVRGVLIQSAAASASAALSSEVRRHGLTAEVDLLPRKIGRALNYAKAKGYGAVLLVHESGDGNLTVELIPIEGERRKLSGTPGEVAASIRF